MDKIDEWVKTCLHKKKLREKWSNDIIKRAESEGNYLRKYYCFHCFHWHVTSKKLKEHGQRRY